MLLIPHWRASLDNKTDAGKDKKEHDSCSSHFMSSAGSHDSQALILKRY